MLRVKTAAYTPGDKTWGIVAPPLPSSFHPWLPTIDRNHKCGISYNDVCSLETTARVGQKTAGDAESALVALTSFLAPLAGNQMVQQLHQFIAGSMRDSIKLFAMLSTSMFQLRRDLALAHSNFTPDERRVLRFSEYVNSEHLFEPELLTNLCEAARKRAADTALTRSLRSASQF